MRRVLLLTSALVASATAATAVELTISGQADLEVLASEEVDQGSQIDSVDALVDAHLGFKLQGGGKGKTSLKYGAQWRFDLDQSDLGDELSTDAVEFEDAYIFLTEDFWTLSLGDAGVASKAQMVSETLVPIETRLFTLEDEEFTKSELELVKYQSSWESLSWEASVDDDMNYAVGVGYEGDWDTFQLNYGATFAPDVVNLSAVMTYGDLKVGLSRFNEDDVEIDPAGSQTGVSQGQTRTWSVASQYDLGGLIFAAAYENVRIETGTTEVTNRLTRYAVGMDYEFTPGANFGTSFTYDEDNSDWYGLARIRVSF